MARVFISYARPEADLSRDLAAYLTSKGHTVWWDAGLLAGDMFEDVITRELDAADVAIVIWTPSSVKSMWVKWEARRAAAADKLITARAENLPMSEVPPPFDGYHCELASSFERINDAIERRMAPPPASDGGGTPITDKRLIKRFKDAWVCAIHPNWEVFVCSRRGLDDRKDHLHTRSMNNGSTLKTFATSENAHGFGRILFSVSGQHFFTQGALSELPSEIWSYTNLERVCRVCVKDFIKYAMWSSSSDGEVLIVEGIEQADVWNVAKRRKTHSFKTDFSSKFPGIGCTAHWGDSSFKLSASKHGLKIWTHEHDLVVSDIDFPRPDRHQGAVRSVAAHHDRKVVLTGDTIGVIKVWKLDVKPYRIESAPKELIAHNATIRHLAFSRNGVFAISYSEDGEVRIWDLREFKCVEVFHNVGESAKTLSLSPDNAHMAVVAEGNLDIYKPNTRMLF